MENKKLIRWPRLVYGVVTLLFAGIIYAWSILKAPFEVIPGWGATQLGLNYTITICFFCIGSFISGMIAKKTSSALRLIVSAVMLFAGFFIVSRIDVSGNVSSNVAVLYIAYGVISGVGVGFAYNTVLGMTSAWFPDKKGLCSGASLMGFGLGSFIVGRVANALGRSENIGWNKTFLIIAIALGVILVAASFLVKPPPAGTVFPAPKARKKARPTSEVRDYTAKEMIKHPSFIKVFVFVALVASAGSASISFARNIMLDVGSTESFAVTIAGILAVFNGAGRLAAGWVFDILSIKKTMFIIGCLAVIAPLVVVLAITASSFALGVIGLCLCGFSYGCGSSTNIVAAGEIFGPKNFSLNLSLFTFVLIPAPFAATLAGRIKDVTDGFAPTFLILAACTAVGFAVGMTLKKEK
ncbi:MAG: MFS transporter [Oscillospiraceae bacterium]|nr:MFS transporter [Oscillospiraceae bacterium]